MKEIKTIDDLIYLIRDSYTGVQCGLHVVKPVSIDTIRKILNAAKELKANMEADKKNMDYMKALNENKS